MNMSKDLEKQLNDLIKGYPALARFAAWDQSQHSTAIFRRFDDLSARNLLHLQSQVAELEVRQRRLDDEDFGAYDELTIARCRDWGKLRATTNLESIPGADQVQREDDERQRRAAQVRLDLADEIQGKVAQYRVFLCLLI